MQAGAVVPVDLLRDGAAGSACDAGLTSGSRLLLARCPQRVTGEAESPGQTAVGIGVPRRTRPGDGDANRSRPRQAPPGRLSHSLQGERSIEADIETGRVGLQLIGLPDTALLEARDQFRSAVINGGHDGPMLRIAVGLVARQFAEAGSGFDLGVAIAAAGAGFGRAVVPVQHAAEAAMVPSVQVISAPAFPLAYHGRAIAAAVWVLPAPAGAMIAAPRLGEVSAQHAAAAWLRRSPVCVTPSRSGAAMILTGALSLAL